MRKLWLNFEIEKLVNRKVFRGLNLFLMIISFSFYFNSRDNLSGFALTYLFADEEDFSVARCRREILSARRFSGRSVF